MNFDVACCEDPMGPQPEHQTPLDTAINTKKCNCLCVFLSMNPSIVNLMEVYLKELEIEQFKALIERLKDDCKTQQERLERHIEIKRAVIEVMKQRTKDWQSKDRQSKDRQSKERPCDAKV